MTQVGVDDEHLIVIGAVGVLRVLGEPGYTRPEGGETCGVRAVERDVTDS